MLSQSAFRSQFNKVKELAPFKVQKIYITASLPKRLEKRFLLDTSLSYTTPIIRAPTYQPQISYNRFHVSSMTTSAIRLAIDIANFMNTKMESDQIGLIFCKSKAEVNELHERFTHCSSHSDLPFSDRAHNEESWRQGESRWIGATTGLIHGIDAPNVGTVIFIGLPYGLINFYQGAGRGGRDGRKSWAILIDITNISQVAPTNLANDLECVSEGCDFLLRKDCCRLPFSECLDGAQDTCLDIPDAHLCSTCDPTSPIVAGITPLLRDPPRALQPPKDPNESEDEYDKYNDSMEIDIDFDQFAELAFLPTPVETTDRSTPIIHPSIPSMITAPPHLLPPTSNAPTMGILGEVGGYHRNMRTLIEKSKLLNRFASRLSRKCVLCWVYRGSLVPEHHQDRLWVRCRPERGAGVINWIGFKRMFRFAEYQNCFHCFLPQGVYCPSSHPTFRKGERRSPCPMQDFVVLFLLFIRYSPIWWDQARLAFRTLPPQPNEREYADWSMVVERQENFFNGLELVLWFLTVFKPNDRT